jgi:ribosomal protein S12 methylthiotransferase
MRSLFKTVRLISLGCPKNLVDSEVMLGLLQERGWTPSTTDDADVIIVNTCAFIREAKEESIETILSMAAAKERGKAQKLVVTGCLPQRYGKELLRELPEVDLFVGTGEFHRIADLLEESGEGKGWQKRVIGKPEFLYDHRTPRIHTSFPGSTYLKISEGCANFCSYCVIPRLRGRLRSRPISSILQEAKQVVSWGVKEINLIGQDITAYGWDRGDKTGLFMLLKGLVKVKGLRWIRLLYAHPAHITPELVHMIRDEEKICKYLDLPFQHVNREILKAMNRPVPEKGFSGMLAWIREEIPGVVLRTSLIVGFPGETERIFRELLGFVKEAQFDRLGVFPYSREEGTPAASLKGQVPDRARQERYREIMRLQKKISLKKQKTLVGFRVPVLVERAGKAPGISWEGRTQGQAPEVDGTVLLTGGSAHPGEMVKVRITDAGPYDLYGKILGPAYDSPVR